MRISSMAGAVDAVVVGEDTQARTTWENSSGTVLGCRARGGYGARAAQTFGPTGAAAPERRRGQARMCRQAGVAAG